MGSGAEVGVCVGLLNALGRGVGLRPQAEVNAGSNIRINNVRPRAIMAQLYKG